MTLVLCSALCIAAAGVTAVSCLRLLPRQTDKAWSLAIVAMPLGQLAFTLSVLWVVATYGLATIYSLGTCAADILGCTGIYLLAQGIATTQRVAVSKERLRAAEEKTRSATEYESLLAENTREMHGLLDGFADELAAFMAEMEKRESLEGSSAKKEATTLDFRSLEGALGKLETTTRSTWCANQTANAILAIKARACTEAGVDFEFTGGVPQELAVDDLKLCSVFSNLLDNAIDAATHGESPRVRVACAAKGAYLVVKVTNSCQAADAATLMRRRKRKDPMREHGWGLEIVSDICSAHGGSFALERTAPTEVCATAILKVAAV